MAVWARRGTEATRLATSRRAEAEKKTEGCATGMHWILIPLELIVLFEKFEEGYAPVTEPAYEPAQGCHAPG